MPHLFRPQGVSRVIATAVAAIAATIFCVATPASANLQATPAAAYLAAHPGGQLLNTHEISYDEGRFIVTLPGTPAINALSNCPFGWYCFWDQPNFIGNMGRLRDCYGQSLATYNWDYRVASAYYNLNTGRAQFRYGTTPLFEVGVNKRSVPNAGSYSWLATHVYRYC